MTNPTQGEFNRGDLVRIWRTRSRVAAWHPGVLALVETRSPSGRNTRVRHAHEPEHILWVQSVQLELVQRGGQ